MHNTCVPVVSEHGDLAAGFAEADQIFAQRYDTGFVHNAQLEPRCALAHWQGETLTLYTPSQGIANCRHDMARDLGLEDQQVRVVCHYMGGGFGNKNQNQDADLIAATLAHHTKAPVMLEYAPRRLARHAWALADRARVQGGGPSDGTVTAIQLIGYSGMGPYRKNAGGISGLELYACPNRYRSLSPVYTNRTTSGNFRAPSEPHGVYGIQSIMDDIAYKLGMDPVAFTLKNVLRPTEGEHPLTNYSLDACIQMGVETFDWQARRKATPGSDPGPIKRGAGFSFMMFRAALGMSSAVVQVDAQQHYTLFVGVTDVGPGAKTTMGMIAAEALGVPCHRSLSSPVIPSAARTRWASRGVAPRS